MDVGTPRDPQRYLNKVEVWTSSRVAEGLTATTVSREHSPTDALSRRAEHLRSWFLRASLRLFPERLAVTLLSR
jgi:hypothetical protein